jgi:hypothetical protein
MKKIATLTMLLFAVLTTQAQSLIGTWQTSMPVDGGNLPLFITFNADKSLRFEFQIPVNDEDLGFLKFSFLIKGTYTAEGKDLTLYLDKNDAYIDFAEIRWSDTLKAAFAENPELEQTVMDKLKAEMEKQKPKFLSSFDEFDEKEELNIDEVSATTLVLSDDDQAITFTRAK